MVVSALSGGHLVPVAGNKAAGSGAAGPAGPTIGRAAPAAVAAAIPAYYIALTGTRKPFPSPDVAGVYSSRTGARLATVVPPRPDRTFIAVSAAADDRTFAVAAQASDGQETSRAVTFYRVRFSPADGTHLTALTAITVPAGATFDGFALSPDGKRLAVASEPNRTALGINGEIQVATLASGRVSTWSSADGAVGGDTAGPWTLSWTGDGRTLAFNWLGYGQYASRITARMAAATGLRLLPAGAPPGDLVKQSRLALHWRDDGSRALASGGAVSDVAMITPDGRRIVAALVGAPADRAPARAGPLAGFAAFSAATGAREYLRGWRRTQPDRSGGPTDILWTSATGDVLIVYAPPGHRGRIGVLRGEQLTQLTLLPQSPAAQFPAAAW